MIIALLGQCGSIVRRDCGHWCCRGVDRLDIVPACVCTCSSLLNQAVCHIGIGTVSAYVIVYKCWHESLESLVELLFCTIILPPRARQPKHLGCISWPLEHTVIVQHNLLQDSAASTMSRHVVDQCTKVNTATSSTSHPHSLTFNVKFFKNYTSKDLIWKQQHCNTQGCRSMCI